MITYTWDIDIIRKDSNDSINDAIDMIHWTKLGENENGVVGRYSGMSFFDINQIKLDSFTPFNEVKQSEVIEWIKKSISEEKMILIDKVILEYINDQITPKQNLDAMPWDAKAG